MNCVKYEEKIQQFYDGELIKTEEPLVFTHLSECPECREFFKTLNTLSQSIQMEVNSYIPNLDEKIFNKIRHSDTIEKSWFLFKRYPAAVLYVLVIVVIFLMLFIIDSEREYKHEMRLALRQIKYQNEKIDLLMNTMPEVHVNSKFGSQVIEPANIQGL